MLGINNICIKTNSENKLDTLMNTISNGVDECSNYSRRFGRIFGFRKIKNKFNESILTHREQNEALKELNSTLINTTKLKETL